MHAYQCGCSCTLVHSGITMCAFTKTATIYQNYYAMHTYQCGTLAIGGTFVCLPRWQLYTNKLCMHTNGSTMCTTYQYQGGGWNALSQKWRGWQSCLVNLSPNSKFLQMQIQKKFDKPTILIHKCRYRRKYVECDEDTKEN